MAFVSGVGLQRRGGMKRAVNGSGEPKQVLCAIANDRAYTSQRENHGYSRRDSDIAETFFDIGVYYFMKGEYLKSEEDFASAAEVAKGYELRCAEYELWRAQALFAARKDEEAMEIVLRLAQHPDLNIRKATHSLERKVFCTQTKISNESYFDVPPFHEGKAMPSVREKFLAATSAGVCHGSWESTAPEPERYTLEWYREKKPAAKDGDSDMNHLVAIAGALFGILFITFSL